MTKVKIGRPRLESAQRTVKVSVRIDEETLEQLQDLESRYSGVVAGRRSAAIRQAIRDSYRMLHAGVKPVGGEE